MSETESTKKRVRDAMDELDALKSTSTLSEGSYLLLCDALKLTFDTASPPDDSDEPPPEMSVQARLWAERQLQRELQEVGDRARAHLAAQHAQMVEQQRPLLERATRFLTSADRRRSREGLPALVGNAQRRRVLPRFTVESDEDDPADDPNDPSGEEEGEEEESA